MTFTLALSSEKGGVGKSTLAVNLAGVFARHGETVLIDEDLRIHSCLDWNEASGGRLPFTVTDPKHAEGVTTGAAFIVIDTEGRPALSDMVELTNTVDLVLIPCGPSGLEVRSTLALWEDLTANGANMNRVRVVITKAPPVGTVGQQARDALREAGVTTCTTVVRAYTAHQRASEAGLLVRDVRDERSLSAWGDIQALGEEVMP